MRILALETTDKTGSVAAFDNDNLLSESDLSHSQRSAQSLVPAINVLLEQVGWRAENVQLVGVSIGPGSFTGLRVGVTAAKVFAYAVGADILAVDTLKAIAAGALGAVKTKELWVAMDAQRGDVVARSFAVRHGESEGATGSLPARAIPARADKPPVAPVPPVTPGPLVAPAGPQELMAADAWLARLAPGTVVTGPALVRLADRLPSGVQSLERRYWFPRAAAVGRLAFRDYTAGRRNDLWKLVPHYFRRSAAEEKWDALGK
jgi:tRNA threonylcarbamoyladenosine biosynthesis protein TsaB